ncbi:hypothetical protein DOTSEDRAFT_70388 [Dothistroma septosporum NZE10]|uniref:ASST-domain-containing protein n=1 Tax=Dothistroma septosporum (strain NZE10 / CBS 128990) TaxID=675120 RepID=N1PSD6_DOTSN|nr:hypothetical protein DOTSEDRAFT_70388 [Dothistroma septosporum NZE10]
MNIFLLFLWHLSLCLHALAGTHASSSPAQPPPSFDEAIDNGTYGYYPTHTFITEDTLNAPEINILQWDQRCDDGLLYFLTPRGWGIRDPGPMILNSRGNLVWMKHFDNKFGGQAYDFKVQRYQGEDYLTFWLGDDRVRGHGSGFYYMLNSSYDIVHRVGAANGLSADLHEFLITPEGTALMTMYEVVEYDLAQVPGWHPDEEQPGPSYIWDCVFQEISIDNGDLVWEWRASDHLNVTSTYHGIGPGGSRQDPFDWFHGNSIEKDEFGNYLVSARYTHSVTYINGSTSEIIWTLGGRMNDFLDLSDGNAINFAWQHDARFLPLDTFPGLYSPPQQENGYTTKLLTLFDNAAEDQHYEYGLPISRGLLLEVTYPNERSDEFSAMSRPYVSTEGQSDLNVQKIDNINGSTSEYTVRVVQSYENPSDVRSSSQGSVQILPQSGRPDPKVLVGYGLNAVFTEFDADGTVLCDMHYGAVTSWERGDIQSYRTYKFAWIGTPETSPKVNVSDDDANVYVSWNGATEVRSWVLQCSDDDEAEDESWEVVAHTAAEGFESSIPIPNDNKGSRYLRIIAVDGNGNHLPYGTSEILDRGILASYWPITNSKLAREMSSMTPLKMLLIAVCSACGALIMFDAYRRYLAWNSGKSHAGPLRWRNGAAYRLLGEA